MKESKKTMSKGLTRRDLLKASGVALGGLALGGAMIGSGAGKAHAGVACPTVGPCYPTNTPTQQYSYFSSLPQYFPNDPNDQNVLLQDDEMRITFLGSMVPPVRRAQQEMSIFVEVGPWIYDPNHPGDPTYGHATDGFVFDCGSGVCANYGAMNIGYGRMDKIFLTHLHADHMSDLSHIYCFGPGGGRFSPLYVWGPGPSGVKSPRPPRRLYDDGTNAFCKNLREAMRWCTESFSFQASSYESYPIPTRQSWRLPCKPIPVGDDPPRRRLCHGPH